MSNTFKSILVLLATIISFTHALPSVVPVLLGTSCSNYPSYNASSNSANPFLLEIVNSDNSTVEGFTSSANFVRGATAVRFGYITFAPVNDPDETYLQCVSDRLQGNVPWGVGGTTWQDLVIAEFAYDAQLIYAVPGTAPQLFEHYDENGVKMDGVFLGGHGNTTAWGVKFYEDAGWHGQNLYVVRLLGEGSQDPTTGHPLLEDEFTAFIKLRS